MRSLYIIFLLSVFVITSNAQDVNSGKRLDVKEKNVGLVDSQFRAEIALDFTSFDLPSKAMIVLTPRLESLDGSKSYVFDELVYAGSNRSKVLKRSDMLSGKETPNVTVVRRKENQEIIPLILTAPYESWMNKSRLVFTEEMSGCASCDLGTYTHIVEVPVLVPYTPNYSLAYIVPEVEAIKQRSREYTAMLNFKVARYEILKKLGDNGRILDEIQAIVDEVKNDKDLTISHISMVGYASPEGNEASNMTLSKNRARSLANYLGLIHNLKPSMFKLDWKGEDWDGLRKAVAASNLTEKDAVIDLIDNTPSIPQRKQKLKSLNKGVTYKELLADYYPPLRRNELVVHFVVKAFSIEEAKEIIHTNPQYLSLNEMYMLANSYPKDSKESKEVFDIASRLYPNDSIAVLNAATAELESGSIDRAIEKLAKIDKPEAWNNLAVAYAKKGNYTKAAELFEKAAKAGVEQGNQNREELQKKVDELR